MIDVLQQPYIATARSKGLREGSILRSHSLKNALLPVLTILGFQLAYLFGGAVITETIFSIPGLGRLFTDAVSARDYPVMQALVLLVCTTVILSNLLVDILSYWANPKARPA